jgi:DNA-binding transcriptional LysR family regulator
MWPTVELREIRAFLILAEELHFAHTAERLGITPSRVSQIIRGLERKLGGELAHRTSRSVELTSLGRRLRERAGPAFGQLTHALAQTHSDASEFTGTLRVSLLSAPAAGAHLHEICRVFEEGHRETHVEVHEVSLDDPFGPIRRGETDLVATWLPHAQTDLVTGPTLAREPRVVAVAPDHPLADRDVVSIEDVADHPVAPMESIFPHEAAAALVPHHTPSGRPIRRHRTALDRRARGDRGPVMTALSYLVVRGELVHLTVASVREYWGHPDIVYVPVDDLPPMRSALVWRHGNRDPRVRELVRIAAAIVDPPPRSARAPDRSRLTP